MTLNISLHNCTTVRFSDFSSGGAVGRLCWNVKVDPQPTVSSWNLVGLYKTSIRTIARGRFFSISLHVAMWGAPLEIVELILIRLNWDFRYTRHQSAQSALYECAFRDLDINSQLTVFIPLSWNLGWWWCETSVCTSRRIFPFSSRRRYRDTSSEL